MDADVLRLVKQGVFSRKDAKRLDDLYRQLGESLERMMAAANTPIEIPERHPGQLQMRGTLKKTRQRRATLYEYNGETMTMMNWSKRVGIKTNTLAYRIRVLKWPMEKALFTPLQHRNKPRPTP